MRPHAFASPTIGPPRASTIGRGFLTQTLPGSQTRGILAFGLFAAVQVADAALTANGVLRYGVAIEGNPVVAFCIHACGLVTGLCAAKAFAICGGTVLHITARYFALAVLTVIFVFGALVPWALTLATL